MQRAGAGLGQRDRRLPERFPDKYMPFMDEDKWGGYAANFTKLSYGPIVRYFRKRHIKQNFDVEPEWRKRGPSLTTGYAKRW